MDFNLVVVAGRLAVAPDFDDVSRPPSAIAGRQPRRPSGGGRLLLTVRSHHPNRVDLLPIAARVGQIPADISAGDRVSVVGRLHRRFSSRTGRSRLEIVAHHIERKAPEELEK